MITSDKFDQVFFRKPNLLDKRPQISNIIGLDTEAYFDGVPFMFCTSYGEDIPEDQIPEVFFAPMYENANFMIYNLKYDSGAILRHLPLTHLKELHEFGDTEYNSIKYEYIPHKLLRLTKGKARVHFWNIAQFYRSTLNDAAKTYLHKEKHDIETKSFTRDYVEKNYKKIKDYCIQDAKLTAELGEYFINKLAEFKISATKLYSSAAISLKYFAERSRVNTVYKLWHENQDLLKYAVDAYSGGKFEVTARGAFSGHEYDICSAYPYEIMNLIDISRCQYTFNKQYQPDAVYGFLDCIIENKTTNIHLPCGLRIDNLRKYPHGIFRVTITKNEFDYITTLKDVSIEIKSAWWIFVQRKRYPYKKVIDYLFKIKDDYKHIDKMMYNNVKVIMNGFYGKTSQIVKDKRKLHYVPGAAWNPIHAAVITANTRVKITKVQNYLGPACLAVHTDSVITTATLPGTMLKNELGGLLYECSGPGTMIACGMYQIGKKNAFKGFDPEDIKIIDDTDIDEIKEDWARILKKYPGQKSIPYPVTRVESWFSAMAKNYDKDRINVFENYIKNMNLNGDSKRVWEYETDTTKLSDSLQQSSPIFIYSA